MASASREELISEFSTHFGATAVPTIASFAPGRLNFIGEHVDYLGGNVVPAAIDLGCTVLMSSAASASASSEVNGAADATRRLRLTFLSREFETAKGPISFAFPPCNGTEASIEGGKSLRTLLFGAVTEAVLMAQEMGLVRREEGEGEGSAPAVPPLDIKGYISSTIPIGAGLSSSAALCVALVGGLLFAFAESKGAALSTFYGNLAPCPSSSCSADVSSSSSSSLSEADALARRYKNRLALAAQAVENKHCGTQCGVMDQYASINGAADTILEVDCAAMSHAAVPLFSPAAGGYCVFLVNSMRAHDLGADYNNVRSDLAAAEAKINGYLAAAGGALVGGGSDGDGKGATPYVTLKQMAGQKFAIGGEELPTTAVIRSLLLATDGGGDAAAAAFPAFALSPSEHDRAAYAVSEMERVVDFVATAASSSAAISGGGADDGVVASSDSAKAAAETVLKRLGALLYATHDGMAQQLRVSTAEIDEIVAVCRAHPELVFGARIMGGGFGGCVLAIVRGSTAAEAEATLRREFAAAFPELGACDVYKVALTDGARVARL